MRRSALAHRISESRSGRGSRRARRLAIANGARTHPNAVNAGGNQLTPAFTSKTAPVMASDISVIRL
jgi:hypothetical protein